MAASDQTRDPAAGAAPEGELARLAIASARAGDRSAWAALLALDETLGRTVARAREPMLAQIKLAWWRERLTAGLQEAQDDPLLAAVAQAFGQDRPALAALVDAWEQLLAPPPLARAALESFADGRAKCVVLLATRLCGAEAAGARDEARLWALVDFAEHCSSGAEADDAMALARSLAGRRAALDRRLRPLAVLGGLARRAARSGRRTMLGDRLSPFVAARIALSGR